MDIKNLKSDEEKEFYAWLLEAEQHNLISNIQYEPESFILSDKKTYQIEKQLKTKSKWITKHLLHPHRYTPDFMFRIEKEFLFNFFPACRSYVAYVDTKGTWANRGAAQEFSINQKWMYEKYNIFINKVIPKKIFHKTWCPEYARYTPKKKELKKAYINCLSVLEFLSLNS